MANPREVALRAQLEEKVKEHEELTARIIKLEAVVLRLEKELSAARRSKPAKEGAV